MTMAARLLVQILQILLTVTLLLLVSPGRSSRRFRQVQSQVEVLPRSGCRDIGNESQVINDASHLACHRSIGNLSGDTADGKAGGKPLRKRERGARSPLLVAFSQIPRQSLPY